MSLQNVGYVMSTTYSTALQIKRKLEIIKIWKIQAGNDELSFRKEITNAHCVHNKLQI